MHILENLFDLVHTNAYIGELMTIEDCEKEIEERKLMTKLQEAEGMVEDGKGWISLEELKSIDISRARIIQAEKERVQDAETITTSEARKRLRERILDNNE